MLGVGQEPRRSPGKGLTPPEPHTAPGELGIHLPVFDKYNRPTVWKKVPGGSPSPPHQPPPASPVGVAAALAAATQPPMPKVGADALVPEANPRLAYMRAYGRRVYLNLARALSFTAQRSELMNGVPCVPNLLAVEELS